MSAGTRKKWHLSRIERGEVVGGGFFVFRRGESTGRIKIDPLRLPFEHASIEAAQRQAQRLAGMNPGTTFSIFQQIGQALVPHTDGDEA